jgi:hypothetical protein
MKSVIRTHRLILALTLTSIVCVPAQANLFRGDITTTITDTTNPYYAPGQSFTGFYEYEAPTLNGVFFAGTGPSLENCSLTGVIGLPGGPAITEESMSFSGPHRGGGALFLAADQVQVTGFRWSFDSVVSPAGEYPYMRLFGYIGFDSFRFEQWRRYADENNQWHEVSYTSHGTVAFSCPQEAIAQVPEASATLGLLALALAGIAILKRSSFQLS